MLPRITSVILSKLSTTHVSEVAFAFPDIQDEEEDTTEEEETDDDEDIEPESDEEELADDHRLDREAVRPTTRRPSPRVSMPCRGCRGMSLRCRACQGARWDSGTDAGACVGSPQPPAGQGCCARSQALLDGCEVGLTGICTWPGAPPHVSALPASVAASWPQAGSLDLEDAAVTGEGRVCQADQLARRYGRTAAGFWSMQMA